ncbi:histidine kinase N-terminal 7TM domain-containing protein [Desulfitobacterium sp. AusDCA]|uniref:sensor histidine kinase n=1 Tax=Desulfitobacterium sp. AusDCA TaxID=3240383 RepID=UPI003DA72B40
MHYQFNLYIGLLIESACISLSLGIYALLKRCNVKGAKSFILSMFIVTIWSAGNALEMASLDFSTKLFWANVQYIAYCYSPVTLLAMSMEFTGYDQWVYNKQILWLAVLPTITILLVWTDSLHGLIRYDLSMDYSGSFPVIDKEYGPFFYIHALYSHMLNFTAWILLIRTVFFKNSIFKKQAAVLLIGISFIMIPNILYISNLSPIQRFDITPVFFGPAGLIIAWGIFRFKLFDIIPIARATVIETMDAGIMILDLQNRVLDINPAFEKIIAMSVSAASTRQVQEICRKVPELLKICSDENIHRSQFSIYSNGLSRIYEVLLSPLTDNQDVLIGKLVITHDITEKAQIQQEHLKQQRKLAATEERVRLARDMHDNLGQVLGFINFQAQGIRQELIDTGIDIASSKLDKLVEVTQSAHDEIRNYIRNAKSSEPNLPNFIQTLTECIENFKCKTGIKVKLDLPLSLEEEKLTSLIRINLLSIIKEALNNIAKHAEATKVTISFSNTQELLCVKIEDNGKGFDLEQQAKKSRTKFGLTIMQERAQDIGAQLRIQSVQEKGTSIAFCMPVEKGEKVDVHEGDVG